MLTLCAHPSLPSLPVIARDVLFAHAFLPLQLAVNSHVPRLVLVALECLEVSARTKRRWLGALPACSY